MAFRFFFSAKRTNVRCPGADETRGCVGKMGIDFFEKYGIIIL